MQNFCSWLVMHTYTLFSTQNCKEHNNNTCNTKLCMLHFHGFYLNSTKIRLIWANLYQSNSLVSHCPVFCNFDFICSAIILYHLIVRPKKHYLTGPFGPKHYFVLHTIPQFCYFDFSTIFYVPKSTNCMHSIPTLLRRQEARNMFFTVLHFEILSFLCSNDFISPSLILANLP